MGIDMSESQERHNCGKTKVDVYGWTIKDGPGQFAWIGKGDLIVDKRYQRDIAEARILRIAKEWSWIACGTLIVARRASEDGAHYVIDGQHRKLAADKRADIAALPCLVFDVEEVRSEADGFVRANTIRGPMSSLDRFKAQVIGEDRLAAMVTKMVSKDGYSIGKGSNFHVACIARLMRCMEASPEIAGKTWDLCVAIYQGKPIHERVYGGIFFYERFLERHEATLFTRTYMEQLIAAGGDAIVKHINNALGYFGRGGERVWAQGIVTLLNHKRSSRRLPNIMDR